MSRGYGQSDRGFVDDEAQLPGPHVVMGIRMALGEAVAGKDIIGHIDMLISVCSHWL